MAKNYLQIYNHSPFSSLFVFIDTIDHLFVRIMNKNGILLKDVKEFAKEDSPYRLIMCQVRKKDMTTFVESVQQIQNMALLLGYREYTNVCNTLQECTNFLVAE